MQTLEKTNYYETTKHFTGLEKDIKKKKKNQRERSIKKEKIRKKK